MKIIKTYSADNKSFRIGDKLLQIRTSDIALIFGIHAGHEHIHLGGQHKPNKQLLVRMCEGVKRLNPPTIEKLISNSMKKKKKENNEDVARLLCLYALVTVFFPTSGTQLSWSYVSYVNDLDEMKTYNWPAAIRSNLESSIEKSHNKPQNVTGCVIALLVSNMTQTYIRNSLSYTLSLMRKKIIVLNTFCSFGYASIAQY